MSKAAAATADVAAHAPAPKGKKKLILVLLAVLVLALVGGGALVMMKKQAAAAAAEDEEDDEGAAQAAEVRRKDASKHPPVFIPLEPFVVNLADKESDRYAQIGITLEVQDAAFGEEMKAYMPAIRNGILMVLSHKTSAQLLSREGKVALAREIMREAVLPLGIEVPRETAAQVDDGYDEDYDDRPRRKRKKSTPNPVKNVHFSTFIVQ